MHLSTLNIYRNLYPTLIQHPLKLLNPRYLAPVLVNPTGISSCKYKQTWVQSITLHISMPGINSFVIHKQGNDVRERQRCIGSFKIFSLSLVWSNLILMGLDVVFVIQVLCVHWAS